MKLDKKKITFIAVIGAVVIFIVTYSILAFGKDDSQKDELQETQVPVLENPIDDYTSRLDAVDDLKEVRQPNAPSIYDEKYLDSTGVFDPDFLEKKRYVWWIVSITIAASITLRGLFGKQILFGIVWSMR